MNHNFKINDKVFEKHSEKFCQIVGFEDDNIIELKTICHRNGALINSKKTITRGYWHLLLADDKLFDEMIQDVLDAKYIISGDYEKDLNVR